MILLDTHVWLWLLHDPSNLSPAAQTLVEIEEPQNGLLVSAISVWEVAVKSSLGKLSLPLPKLLGLKSRRSRAAFLWYTKYSG